jgi:superoxide reductase
MTNRLQVYRCDKCGNIVEVVHASVGELVCCGQPMRLLEENTTDAATEKHVPVVERTADGIKVRVGDVAHPMEEKHFIEWIELTAGDETHIAFLAPGMAPEATFAVQAKDVTVREYCTIHGFWKA